MTIESALGEITGPLTAYQRLNLQKQVDVYRRAIQLRGLGLPYSEIRTQIVCEFGAVLQKSTLSYWVRGLHKPLGRAYDFQPAPSEELAYLIGVQKGDGSLNVTRKTYNYRIRLQSIDTEFVEEFDRCLSRALRSHRHASWVGAGRREIHVVGSSFLLHRFLSQPFSGLKPFVEHCRLCVASFLRGFFDSEECVDKSGSVTASNSDKELLEYAQLLLVEYFGIATTGPFLRSQKGTVMTARGERYIRNTDCFVIRLRNKSRQAFLDAIGITISRKRVRLSHVLRKDDTFLARY